MADVMLVQPWNHHDEGVREHDLAHEWRNGPYSLLLLATILREHGHRVAIVDMTRDLVACEGSVDACLAQFAERIRRFRPDIVGFGFFSIHYCAAQRALVAARETCATIGISPLFIAGGIHATVEPETTLTGLGFDYAFVGEADRGIVQLADGAEPATVPGVFDPAEGRSAEAETVAPLDVLPFPDWSLCDYRFYAHPSYAKLKISRSRSLDMVMGRGCTYQCNFCAYGSAGAVRFYTAEYLVEQLEYMKRAFDVDAVYFTDSTIGNNRRLLREFCELMIRRGTAEHVEWYGNIRVNQVSAELLGLMWRAGCRYLLYGFESGSQRMLDRMSKGTTVEDNRRVVELHNRLRFPYDASMIFGYPGEREEDIQATLDFLRKSRPPSIGINWYVPLPGSPDYYELKRRGRIRLDDPEEWQRIGEVNDCRVYADVPDYRFLELFAAAQRLAYVEIPKIAHQEWCAEPCSQT